MRLLAAALVLSAALSAQAQGACPLRDTPSRHYFERMQDGDTLLLRNGRQLRLPAVNSPEFSRTDGNPQPLAPEAYAAAQDFLRDAPYVLLVPPQPTVDRYGRWLAHVYHPDGRSLEEHLLRRGLAFHLAIPPHLNDWRCLREVEQEAQRAKRGVWGHSYFRVLRATSLPPDADGFQRVRGAVQRLHDGNSLWILLRGEVAVRIPPGNRRYFRHLRAGDLHEREIEVRGWLRDARGGDKPWVMELSHPAQLRILQRSLWI